MNFIRKNPLMLLDLFIIFLWQIMLVFYVMIAITPKPEPQSNHLHFEQSAVQYK